MEDKELRVKIWKLLEKVDRDVFSSECSQTEYEIFKKDLGETRDKLLVLLKSELAEKDKRIKELEKELEYWQNEWDNKTDRNINDDRYIIKLQKENQSLKSKIKELEQGGVVEKVKSEVRIMEERIRCIDFGHPEKNYMCSEKEYIQATITRFKKALRSAVEGKEK